MKVVARGEPGLSDAAFVIAHLAERLQNDYGAAVGPKPTPWEELLPGRRKMFTLQVSQWLAAGSRREMHLWRVAIKRMKMSGLSDDEATCRLVQAVFASAADQSAIRSLREGQ